MELLLRDEAVVLESGSDQANRGNREIVMKERRWKFRSGFIGMAYLQFAALSYAFVLARRSGSKP
jgi:hypothetical protein